jgi:hypothetical protein
MQYLVISRGQWDPDLSRDQIQDAIDRFYAWHGRLVDEGRMQPGQRLAVEGKLVSKQRVIDGPYAEAKEVIGGWAVVKFDSEEEARAEGQAMADLHLKHWPGWEGAIEIRRIAEPDEAPTGS